MKKLKKFLLGAAALFLGVTGTAAASFPAYADGAMGGRLQGPYPWPRLDRYGKG